MKKTSLLSGIALLMLGTLLNAQKPSNDTIKWMIDSVRKEVEKYSQIDYLTYDYKYLDDDLKIIMSGDLFDSIVNARNFYKERILKYSDSIVVVLCAEFESDIQQRVASTRLTMTWLRVSYYIWISESETKVLGRRYAFKYPYELYDYINYRQQEWDKYMKRFIKDLRKKVLKETGNEELAAMDHKMFLAYALRMNPTRIEDFIKVKEERRANR